MPYSIWNSNLSFGMPRSAANRRAAVMSAESWWDLYILDPEFRYGEELLAHVEEYRIQAAVLTDRNARAKLSMRTAAPNAPLKAINWNTMSIIGVKSPS